MPPPDDRLLNRISWAKRKCADSPAVRRAKKYREKLERLAVAWCARIEWIMITCRIEIQFVCCPGPTVCASMRFELIYEASVVVSYNLRFSRSPQTNSLNVVRLFHIIIGLLGRPAICVLCYRFRI